MLQCPTIIWYSYKTSDQNNNYPIFFFLVELLLFWLVSGVVSVSQSVFHNSYYFVWFLCMFVQNKSKKFSNTLAQDKSLKARRYMESRSSLRQVCIWNTVILSLHYVFFYVYVLIFPIWTCLYIRGDQGVLANRRSNFQGNQLPFATEVARKAVAAPLHYGAANRNQMANWNKTRYYVFLLLLYAWVLGTRT